MLIRLATVSEPLQMASPSWIILIIRTALEATIAGSSVRQRFSAEQPLRYPEWSNGEAGAELTGHYMLRGSCLLEVIGQEVFPGSRNDVVYHLELKNYPEEVAPFCGGGLLRCQKWLEHDLRR